MNKIIKANNKITIFMAFYVLLYSNISFSTDLNFEDCVKLLGAGMYNQYLENYCDFDGMVSNKLKRIYTVGGCRNTVPQEVVESMAKKVTDDSGSRMNNLGRRKFCTDNRQAYYNLSADEKSLKKSSSFEEILSCKDKPQPYKTINQLLNDKIISKTNLGADSISYFKVIKPLNVWGLEVKYIFGHDEEISERYYKKLFTRSLGTSPGHLIGVSVAQPVSFVKEKLKSFDLEKKGSGISIDEDYIINSMTSISCSESLRER